MGGEALRLERLSVTLGGTQILKAIDLTVEPGSFTALLGPSGCGKTTLLRAIAGFAPVTSGDVRIGSRSVAGLPPERRETAMVFQSYALWPHMNVGGNLAYPLKLRRVPRAERTHRVEALLDRLGLAGFAGRPVASLSGGQRQRIALGRALIIDPPILLLDEPLSNLDAGIRRNLRSELRQLQRQVGITTIMVTHDQEEALSMADQVVLMRDGRIVQTASADRLYTAPADLDAARFLGVDNVLPTGEGDALGQGGHGEDVLVGFRSPDARASPPQRTVGGFTRRGSVRDCAYVGGAYQVQVEVGEIVLTALSSASMPIGTLADVSVPPAALMFFGAKSSRLLKAETHSKELSHEAL